MYLANLAELEILMQGHGMACQQLGIVVDRQLTFNWSFVSWLEVNKGCSKAAGWAVAIEELARVAGIDPIAHFFELVEEFMDSQPSAAN